MNLPKPLLSSHNPIFLNVMTAGFWPVQHWEEDYKDLCGANNLTAAPQVNFPSPKV